MASREENSEAVLAALNPFADKGDLDTKEQRITDGESLPAIRYVNDAGDFVVKNFPISTAPNKLEIDGIIFRRAAGSIPRYARAGFNQYPKVSKTLPQWCAGADHTDLGEAIIESDRHESELCDMHGFTREYHHKDMPYRDRDKQAEVDALIQKEQNAINQIMGNR
jgi:hypothetical protein